jgi:outer membrane receptor for ferrienterochelin and colicins
MRILAAVLALIAFSARADSVADEADFRFRRGAALIRSGDVEGALSEFLGSYRLVRNRNVVFNIARSFELLHRSNEAFRWYQEVLDDGAPEGDRKAVEQAIDRLRPQLALLRIESEPPGATVYIDRKDLGARGQTPVTLALPPGKVLAMVELAGYRGARGQSELQVGQTRTLLLAPQRIFGKVALSGQPGEVEIRVDKATGPAVQPPLLLVPGEHLLFLSADGFAAQQLPVQVPPDATVSLEYKLLPLPPPTGTLVVRANVEGALLRLDGKEAGFTPDVIKNVAVGRHFLEIISEGREPHVEDIQLHENERKFMDVRLSWQRPRVVAAERQLTRAEDAPASVSVITRAEILAFGYSTLAQALRPVRGLYVTSDRTRDSFGVRGFSPPGVYNDKVLVLSDGHVTNDISSGQGFIGHDFDVDLDDVERIEVVRGPGSVLYGSAAFLAVVNVVHRGAQRARSFEAGALLGSLTESAGHLIAAAGDASAGFTARVAGLRQDGESVFAAPARTGSSSRFALDLDGEDAEHADLRAHAGDFALNAVFNRRNKSIPTGPFDSFGLPGADAIDQRFFIEGSYSHTLASGLGVDARVSEDGARSRQDLPAQGDIERATRLGDWTEGELRLRLPAWAGNRAFLGGEVQDLWRTRLQLTRPGAAGIDESHAQLVGSAYAGDDLRLGERVELDLAVRVDGYSGGSANEQLPPPQVHPRVALIARPAANGTLKLIFGTAYRAPTLNERYFRSGRQIAGEGTPDERGRLTDDGLVHLTPESVRTGEFEYTQQLTEDLSMTASGYWSRIDDIIRLKAVKLVDGESGFRFQNKTAMTFSAGAEGEVRWQPRPDAMIAFWYAYNQIRNNNGNPDVPNAPSHSGALRVIAPVAYERLSIATELVYNSARIAASDDPRLPDVTLGESLNWNVGLTGVYTPWHLRYGAFVDDLLDERPLLPGGLEIPFPNHAVPQLGRTLRLSFSASF